MVGNTAIGSPASSATSPIVIGPASAPMARTISAIDAVRSPHQKPNEQEVRRVLPLDTLDSSEPHREWLFGHRAHRRIEIQRNEMVPLTA
jgi:hypothetical protein